MHRGMHWLLLTAGVLGTAFGGGTDASYQPGNGVIVRQLAAGTLLVAGRNLPDPNFSETVVLLVEYSGDGAAGLVLNRPSGAPLSRVLPSVQSAAGVASRAFSGGPVSTGTVLALSRAPCDGCRAIARDVHLVRSSDTLTALLADDGDERRLRVYAGYAGWARTQLEDEVRQGAWRVLAVDARIVFDPNPSSLWRRMIERTEAVLANLLTRGLVNNAA